MNFLNSNSKCAFWNWDTETCDLNQNCYCNACKIHVEQGTKSKEELEAIKNKILGGKL